jgi:hypothetical protein
MRLLLLTFVDKKNQVKPLEKTAKSIVIISLASRIKVLSSTITF